MTDVTVLVVDDQRLIREGISSLLEIQEGIHVVSTATDGRQAVEQGAREDERTPRQVGGLRGGMGTAGDFLRGRDGVDGDLRGGIARTS